MINRRGLLQAILAAPLTGVSGSVTAAPPVSIGGVRIPIMTAAPTPKVFVLEGTPAWDAWKDSRACAVPIATHNGKKGWWFDALYPPRTAQARLNRSELP